MPSSYFAAIPFVAILSNILAFLIAAVLSFPCAYLKSFLSNKFLITLIIMVGVFVLGFYGYMQVLNSVVEISDSIGFRVNDIVVDTIAKMAAVMYPNIFLSNILYVEKAALSTISLLLMLCFLGILLALLVTTVYKAMLINGVGGERAF